ncbi:MAG: hypothetical protein IKS41_05385 [Alphaproteobacteria bacterium]|nr:hypothetical protein [Alphaproteobacteria bacterium]
MKIPEFAKSFLTFRLIILIGIAMGLWLFSVQTEQVPLSVLLTETRIYLISFMIVLGFHVLLWIIVQKASFYDIGGYVWRIIRDTVIINAVMLSTTAACFLYHIYA